MPDVSDHLTGPTAIIIGGNNPSGVAKALGAFFKKKEKVELKVGILDNKTLDTAQIEALAKLPGLESLRAQLLGLLTQPGTGLVRVLNAIPQNVVNVLQAKVREDES